MKKLLTSIMAVVALAGIQAFAQEEEQTLLGSLRESTKCNLVPSSISLSFDYKSRYLSDGCVVNPQNMLFGSVDASWDFSDNDGLYIGIWGANDLNRYNHDSKVKYEFEEFDYYIGYWYSFGENFPLTLDLSYTYWDYPSRTQWEGIGEQQNTIALDATFDVFLKPGITVSWDPENEKIYGKIHAFFGKTFEDVCKDLEFGTGLDLFWGNGQYCSAKFIDVDGTDDIDKETFTTLIWTVKATYAVTDKISFGPFAQLAWALDHECRDSWKTEGNANAKSGCNTCWGVSASIKF